MLKEKLIGLTSIKLCSIGAAVEKMDAETRTAFEECMRSSVGHKTIADALRSEGLRVSRDAVRERRKCFVKETESQCRCKILEKKTKK